MALFTHINLVEYKKRIERQQECLKFSLVFSDAEKVTVNQCYQDLIAICDQAILKQKLYPAVKNNCND